VKTARFATVVDKFGEPEPYLVLIDPAKDKALQSAIKANRVMTVFQPTVGTAADQGVVGFEPGTRRQFLIFPKSLRALSGQKIVGIKYDLLKTKPIPKSERAPIVRHAKRPARAGKQKVRSTAASPSNVLPFKTPDASEEDDEDTTVADLKRKVRRAMDVLEKGKAVAAYNLLKRIVES
jgi:hypothetical protein